MLSCFFLTAMWYPVGKRFDLFVALCVMFSSGFAAFRYGVQGQESYLIVSIPDLCFILYFQVCIEHVFKQLQRKRLVQSKVLLKDCTYM